MNALLVVLLSLFCAFEIRLCGQNLTDIEKENIHKNVQIISNDSALATAKSLIMAGTFYDLSKGEEQRKQIKSIHTGLEILSVIEYRNLKNDDYYGWRAAGYKLLNNCEQAIKFYSKAILINPNNVIRYIKRAECKIATENFYGAIPDINRALISNPNDDALYGHRGFCFLMTEQWEKALADSNKAIAINESEGSYYITRGFVHIQLERKERGCLDFNTAGDLGDERAFELIKELCSSK